MYPFLKVVFLLIDVVTDVGTWALSIFEFLAMSGPTSFQI